VQSRLAVIDTGRSSLGTDEITVLPSCNKLTYAEERSYPPLCIIGIAVAAVVVGLSGAYAFAQEFSAPLSGFQEIPTILSNGRGTFMLADMSFDGVSLVFRQRPGHQPCPTLRAEQIGMGTRRDQVSMKYGLEDCLQPRSLAHDLVSPSDLPAQC
jgi:hypothetical protein